MSVKTLSEIQTLGSAATGFRRHTYSIDPVPADIEHSQPSTDLEVFLNLENPLGCARGVFFVMGFNAAFFLLGFLIWQAYKHL